MTGQRNVLLVSHTGRRDIVTEAKALVGCLRAKGFAVRALAEEATQLSIDGLAAATAAAAVRDVELVLALGGDGTFLRAAELAKQADAPLLGVNLGQVGFLAEAELSDMAAAVDRLQRGEYTVERRLTLEAVVTVDGREVHRGWALNEATIEKERPARMLEVLVEVDDRRLSRYGCDGVVCATPTGSTAHAMSAGGPVVWPGVEALLLVPISAHTLFSRPLVVAPESTIAITVESHAPSAVLTCDGSRAVEVEPGATVTVRRGEHPVRVVRLARRPFTDRLVAKLALPVDGWRGHRFA